MLCLWQLAACLLAADQVIRLLGDGAAGRGAEADDFGVDPVAGEVKAVVDSLSKQLLFYIPAMLILSRIWWLTGILMAGLTADVLSFILCMILCIKEVKKMEKAETH